MDNDRSKVGIIDRLGWSHGRKPYLWLKVTDTGGGMTLDEQKKLFSRFSQATPRTHIKYGGSSPGLFISRFLSALQGGAIGIYTEKGDGSTFAFFVNARLADPPTMQVKKQDRPGSKGTASIEDAMKSVKPNVLIVEEKKSTLQHVRIEPLAR